MRRGRIRIRGDGKKQSTDKRKSFTYRHKLQVINFYQTSNCMKMTLKKFYPELNARAQESRRKLIYQWINNKDEIEEKSNTIKSNQRRNRDKGVGTSLPKEAEEKIAHWAEALRQDNVLVSTTMLRAKALDVAEEFGIAEGTFTASWNWRQGFNDRFGFSKPKQN